MSAMGHLGLSDREAPLPICPDQRTSQTDRSNRISEFGDAPGAQSWNSTRWIPCSMLSHRPGMTDEEVASKCSSLDSFFDARGDLPVALLCRSWSACVDGQITGTSSRHPAPDKGDVAHRHERWTRGAVDASSATDECATRGR